MYFGGGEGAEPEDLESRGKVPAARAAAAAAAAARAAGTAQLRPGKSPSVLGWLGGGLRLKGPPPAASRSAGPHEVNPSSRGSSPGDLNSDFAFLFFNWY